MKKLILLIGISLFIISGCSTFGTKTIYTISATDQIKLSKLSKIGFSQLANEEILLQIEPNTSKYFELAVSNFLQGKSIEGYKYNLQNFENFNSISKDEIKDICVNNNLDGFLCTQIKYIYVHYSYNFIPLGISQDTEVEIQLFDRNGDLLVHSLHNTHKGNSYFNLPLANRTVEDGVVGALIRIFKIIGIK